MSLLLIGSGPHNLTALTFLLQASPQLRDGLRVLDPSGNWLTRWNFQLEAQEIVHLRSSSVHHPDPDPLALRRFAKGRYDELYPPYFLPGTPLFRQFCDDVIARFGLGGVVEAGTVTGLAVEGSALTATLSSGEVIKPRQVIVSLGGGERVYPAFYREWLATPESRRQNLPPLCHSEQADLRTLGPGEGKTLLVVGGGLTAGHLALGALKRGWKVVLVARRRLQYKLFDSAPGWIGPKFLAGFLRETRWERRRQMIAKARGGGAMTEEIRDLLAPFRKAGLLVVKENCEVRRIAESAGRWTADCGWRRCLGADVLWMATGNKLDLREHPLFRQLWATHPLQMLDGLPVLDADCRWPGLPLYLTGLPAALRVGPTARNFPGARKVASLIARSVTGVRVDPT